MNVDDKDREAVTEFDLSLGYSNLCIKTRLNNDSGAGAGANAGSRVDLVTTNPLSELVWSPRKRLAKPTLLWSAEPRNMVNRSSSVNFITEENFTTPLAACDGRSEVAGQHNFISTDAGILPVSRSSHELKTATNDQVEDLETAVGITSLQRKEEVENDRGEAIPDPVGLQEGGNSRTMENETSSFPDELKLAVAQNDKTSEGPTVAPRLEAYDGEMQNAASLSKELEESPSLAIKGAKSMRAGGLLGDRPPEKLESTDENDLQTSNGKNDCGMASKILSLESPDKLNSHHDGMLPGVKTLVLEPSVSNSGVQMDVMKGKGKALSDGNVNGRTSNEEEDSHESVESCNSAGSFSTRKQGWSTDPQLIAGTRNVKRKIEGSLGSSSFVRQDSSFMNWIANMMRAEPHGHEAPSLALSIAKPNRESQNLSTCSRNQDPACRVMGFQSIFLSLYCPKRKNRETATLDEDCRKEEPTEPDLNDKSCNINATPIACRIMTDNAQKRLLLSSEKLNESTYNSQTGTMGQPKDVSLDGAAHQDMNRSISAGHKNPCDLAADKDNDGASSKSSSLVKRKRNEVEKIDSELPSEGKMDRYTSYGSHPRASLWVTRFTPKTSGLVSNKDLSNNNIDEGLECTTDVVRLKSQLQKHQDSSDDLKIVEGRRGGTEDPHALQNCATSTEASFGYFTVKGQIDEKSISKLTPVLPFPRIKSSEVMASVFAKRLDALKHIMPSDTADIPSCETVTCFFCGVRGHHLQDCPEVPTGEIEALLRSISSYDGTEKISSICIRCFQPNHWAAACPNTFSKTWLQEECGFSLINKCGHRNIQLNARNEENSKLPEGSASQFQAAYSPTICDGNDSSVKKGFSLNLRLAETTSSGKMKLNADLVEKGVVSSYIENTTKKHLIAPFCNLVNCQSSDVPKGIFDAVKGLRLSRSDILKWMNAQMPLSHLDGFFLRLRLGKWEEGLGGTGYYVACINGLPMESLTRKSKRSIAVNVGGVKCFIESPFVSNNDFLEDELMAWWSATLKSGGKMPSEEDLRLKAKEKKMLGF